MWISKQTAIIPLYNINLIGFYKQGKECLLRGTDWTFKPKKLSFFLKGLIQIQCYLRITEQARCKIKSLDTSINYAVICNNCKYYFKKTDSGVY
jgi:hypothetical protein